MKIYVCEWLILHAKAVVAVSDTSNIYKLVDDEDENYGNPDTLRCIGTAIDIKKDTLIMFRIKSPY